MLNLRYKLASRNTQDSRNFWPCRLPACSLGSNSYVVCTNGHRSTGLMGLLHGTQNLRKG